MEDKISSNLASAGQKLIHSIQVKLRIGPAKSERIAVLSNTYFSIFQKTECKKSFLWIELSSIIVTDKDITLKFGKTAFRIYPTDPKFFLSCIFDVIQRVLLPSELEKLDFDSFHSFVALPNPFSVSSRIRMKIEESSINYDRSFVQPIIDTLSYLRKELNLSKFSNELIPFIIDIIPLYHGLRSIKISSSGKIDAYQYVSKLVLEKTNLRLIEVKGYSNSNFDNYITNLSLNKSPKLLTLSFESSFFQQSQLNSIKNLYKKSNLKGLEFHDAISPQAFDFFHDSFFLSLNLKSLNLDGTRGLNLPRILILIPNLIVLSLESCDLDISDVIVQIQKLNKLRSINLSGNRCTDFTKLSTPLPPNVITIFVNNVTWEKHCLVEFFKYRLMKLSISYISTSTDEWQRLFDSFPENPNNTLASITWDGNNVHTNFFNYLKNQICMDYLSLNDCFTHNHPECLSYLIDYLRNKDLALTEISLRGTESNHIGEYLPNVLNVIFNSTKISTIDIYGQRGGDQALLTIKENIGNMKVISCDKNYPTKSGPLVDLAEKANSYQVWLSYPSDDISMLIHLNKMSVNESRSLYNKFRMLPKRIKKQPPRVLYPPPSSSAFDFPFQVYKFIPQNDFPRYIKDKQLALYEKAPPMSKIAPSIRLANGQKQVVMTPQTSPKQQDQILNQPQEPKQSPVQIITNFEQQETRLQAKFDDYILDPTINRASPSGNQMNYGFNRQSPSSYKQNQQASASPKANQIYNRVSPPSSSKSRQKTGSNSPNSMYKEMARPPPPRFIFEDDPITLEMSREDETILPTIDEEFFPYNNEQNDYNNYQNNRIETVNNNISKRNINVTNTTPNRSRNRPNQSRNERAIPRNHRRIERPEEEEENFFDYDDYDEENNNIIIKRNTRRHHYNDERENDGNIKRSSRPRGRRNQRSTSQQERNRHHRNNYNDIYEEDNDNHYYNKSKHKNDEYDEYDIDERIKERSHQRTQNRSNSRNARSRSRNIPATERVKRTKPRLHYEDEDDFENENENEYDDEYEEENEYKNQRNRRRHAPTSSTNRNKRTSHTASKTPSPYNRQKQTQSQRPRKRQTEQQPQQQTHSQHRKSESNRLRQRSSNRNNNYNYKDESDDNDEYENYDENEYENNDSDEFIVERKPKAQSQRRIRNIQQSRPKQPKRGQSHRPRNQKLQNDYDEMNGDDDDDDDQEDEEYDENIIQTKPRQSHRQNQIHNQPQQSRRQVQRRSEAVPERNYDASRKQKVERNRDVPIRQQSHSRNRNRINNRISNYNKDFNDENNSDDDNYDNDYEKGDDVQSYSAKRKIISSQRNPSRNHSRRKHSENAQPQKIVRSLNRDGSPKPSRRPAPKYVKDFSFSSESSFE